MFTLKQREDIYLPVVATAFARQGLAPEFGAAIARQESAFDPSVKVLTGGDAALGGSYGLCCMGLSTARGLGHKDITVEQLLDPAINASLAAELCAANLNHLLKVGPDQTYSAVHLYGDLASYYNSGKPMNRAPHITQTNYVPSVLKYMALYADRCKDIK